MPTEPRVNQLSPDGYSRFYYLVDILHEAFKDSKKTVNILDVGGGSEYLDQQLKDSGLNYRLTILDVLPRPLTVTGDYIQADATSMKLDNNSFDAVVSTDVIEHIPQELKVDFLSECVRVAKDVCIIAGPFDTEGVHEVEVIVNDFNKQLFGTGQSWLEEHFQFGKPSMALFKETLQTIGMPYDSFGTLSLTTWLLNTHINLIDAKLGLDADAHRLLNSFYGENILEMNEIGVPTYRQFFVIYKQERLAGKLNIQKYLCGPLNHKKFSSYLSLLIQLLSTRISELKLQDEQALQRIFDLEIANIANLDELEKLRIKVGEQAGVLDKIRPLLALVRSKPIRTVRILFSRSHKIT